MSWYLDQTIKVMPHRHTEYRLELAFHMHKVGFFTTAANAVQQTIKIEYGTRMA